MKNRIVVTTIHELAASQYERGWRKGLFRPISHLPLCYGVGCDYTEADFAKTVTYLMGVVKEEKSRVLVFGLLPRSITSSWIKAAELVIGTSGVEIVIIPIAKLIGQDDADNPMLDTSILFIDKTGIFQIEKPGNMPANDFVELFTQSAKLLNEQVS